MLRIAILGSGGFGLALAASCDRLGHEVTVWSAFSDEIAALRRTRELRAKLPGIRIPETVELTTDISCVKDKDIVLVGIPTKFVRDVCSSACSYLDEKTIIVSTSKGLEDGTLKRMTEVISEVLPKNKIVALTGPSHAEELGKGIPTAVVVACDDRETSALIQKAFSDTALRLYINNDVIGSEIGGAVKNVIALCCGVAEGLGLGDNTKAAIMTRGLNEIMRLGVAMGGKPDTFYGLAGMGDLVVTCTSMHSRNMRAGILIGQGISPEEAVHQIGTVEGYACANATLELARKYNIDMPITLKINEILFNSKSPKEAISELMLRPYGTE